MREKIAGNISEGKENYFSNRVVLEIDDISAIADRQSVFNNLSFIIRSEDTVALIGDNDYAKSLLLKIISKHSFPDSGNLMYGKNVSVESVLRDQDFGEELLEKTTIKDFFYQSRGLDKLEEEKERLEQILTHDSSEQNVNRYYSIIEEYERKGAYTADSEIRGILNGLSLGDKDIGLMVGELSSGQRSKLILGRAVFSKKDLLVLDDPVTYLDTTSRLWLAKFLKNRKQACIVLSNDNDFLRLFCNSVVEIMPSGRSLVFNGNYDDFLKDKEMASREEETIRTNLYKKTEQLERTLREQKVWGDINTAASVNVRRTARRIDCISHQIESLAPLIKPKTPDVKLVYFEGSSRSGKDVLKVSKLRKVYENGTLIDFSSLNLLINYGDRMIVLGENGSGKSTFLRLIAQNGVFHQNEGEINFGEGIKLGYYASEYADITQSIDKTIYQAIVDDAFFVKKVRNVLNFLGFNQRDANTTKVSSLVGSEKARFFLAKLMVSDVNLLILDEPTMGLSPTLRDRLVEALNGFKGTLIVSSHDVDFLSKLTINKKMILPDCNVETLTNG